MSTENTEIDRLLAAFLMVHVGVDDAMSSLQALDDTARTARQALQTARQQAKQAVEALTRADGRGCRPRSGPRDPLVALGAPPNDSDLLTAWTTLTDWAGHRKDGTPPRLDPQLSQAEAALHQAGHLHCP